MNKQQQNTCFRIDISQGIQWANMNFTSRKFALDSAAVKTHTLFSLHVTIHKIYFVFHFI